MDKVTQTVGISFGVLSGTIRAQLKKQKLNFDDNEIKKFELFKVCIHRLRFSEILNDTDAKKSFDKLYKKIMSHLNKKN